MRLGMVLRDRALVEETVAQLRVTIDSLAGTRWSRQAHIGAGWLLADAGDERGIDMLQEGGWLQSKYIRAYQPLYAAVAIATLLRFGRRGEAREALAQTRAMIEETGERWCDAELHRLGGMAALEATSKRRRAKASGSGGSEEAEAGFRRAIDLARAQGARLWELRACVSLAELLRQTDRASEATKLLRAVYATFDASLDLPDVRAAEEMLAQRSDHLL
jgi:predicted ATPase